MLVHLQSHVVLDLDEDASAMSNEMAYSVAAVFVPIRRLTAILIILASNYIACF